MKISVECFTLAQKFLPSDEDKMKARLCFLRAKTILSIGESSQYAQAKKDAQTYVELRPSKTKVVTLYVYFFSFTRLLNEFFGLNVHLPPETKRTKVGVRKRGPEKLNSLTRISIWDQ